MLKKELVSIVTPCFNGEAYLDRYFESVIAQTYSNIELVFVDDGSTDETFRIAESYRDALSDRGISYKLIHQENSGQAAAINRGLEEVTGEYLTWPDSDDMMTTAAIEERVHYLQDHSEYGAVCCAVDCVAEDKLNCVVQRQRLAPALDGTFLFDALIREEGAYCTPVAYMVRTKLLFEVLGGRKIYETRAGQNWQLLFPLTYRYRCGYIDRPLVSYVVRSSSHSHSVKSPEDQLQRTYDLEDVIQHVLPVMNMTDEDQVTYEHYVGVKYLKRRFILAIRLGDATLAQLEKDKLDKEFGSSISRDFLFLFVRMGLGPAIYRLSRIVSPFRMLAENPTKRRGEK